MFGNFNNVGFITVIVVLCFKERRKAITRIVIELMMKSNIGQQLKTMKIRENINETY